MLKRFVSVARKSIHFGFLAVISFLYVFDLSFVGYPSISTGRVALLLMLLLHGREISVGLVRFVLANRFFFLVLSVLLVYAFVSLALNGVNDRVLLSRVVWFVTFSIVGAHAYLVTCGYDIYKAMLSFALATLIQAGFVFLSVIDPGFREWAQSSLEQGGHIDFTDTVRFSGLSNSGGALLSVQLALGVAACVVLAQLRNETMERLRCVLIASIITLATVFVGRTGFFVSLLLLLVLLASFRGVFLITLAISAVAFSAHRIFARIEQGINVNDNQIDLERTLNWAFELFLYGESSSASVLIADLANLREMTVPMLVFGSGRVSDSDGANYAGHDSGYIQALYSLGLPLSVVFYIAILYLFVRMLRVTDFVTRRIGYCLVLLMMMLEVKEPFIFKYTIPFFILVFTLASRHRIIRGNIGAPPDLTPGFSATGR